MFFGLFFPCKAFAAVVALTFHRSERNFGGTTARSTRGIIVFSACFYGVLARLSAFFTALGLVLETLFSVEFLLAGSENKLFTTFFADECFVFKHGHQHSVQDISVAPTFLRARCRALSTDFSVM